MKILEKLTLLRRICIVSLILTACSLGNGNPQSASNFQFTLINGNMTNYTDNESGISIKKLLGNNSQQLIYALNSKGNLWQYNIESKNNSWLKLNVQNGLPANFTINDFYVNESPNLIFVVGNNGTNSYAVYNPGQESFAMLNNIPNPAGNVLNSTIISGGSNQYYQLQYATESIINLFIGQKSVNAALGPQISFCTYNVISNTISSCIIHSFNNEIGNSISSITSTNDIVFVSIGKKIYVNTNFNNDFNAWALVNTAINDNIIQIFSNGSELPTFIAVERGLAQNINSTFVVNPIIPSIPNTSLNSQIGSFDSANSLWIATTNKQALYSINTFNVTNQYNIITGSINYAPITSLFVINKISANSIYIGNNQGQVLAH